MSCEPRMLAFSGGLQKLSSGTSENLCGFHRSTGEHRNEWQRASSAKRLCRSRRRSGAAVERQGEGGRECLEIVAVPHACIRMQRRFISAFRFGRNQGEAVRGFGPVPRNLSEDRTHAQSYSAAQRSLLNIRSKAFPVEAQKRQRIKDEKKKKHTRALQLRKVSRWRSYDIPFGVLLRASIFPSVHPCFLPSVRQSFLPSIHPLVCMYVFMYG